MIAPNPVAILNKKADKFPSVVKTIGLIHGMI